MASRAVLELLVELKDQASPGLSTIGGSLKTLGTIGLGVAAGGIAAVGAALVSGIGDAREAAQIMAQTEAVIRSTGSAAGVSAQEVADYAASLSAASGKSLFGDDQIQQSENLLLTFTNIKGTALEAATAISVDMAQALGGAPKDSAIQLGKALNDPIQGITALTRVGVTFTDQQKKQIKTMQLHGDIAGAQKVILEELNKEFGGSAEAAAKADGGWAQFKDRMGEAAESIGGLFLPLLNQAAGFLNDTVAPAIEATVGRIGELIQAFQTGAEGGNFLGGLINALYSLEDVSPVFTTIGDALTILGGLISDTFGEGGGIGVLLDDLREMTGLDLSSFVETIQSIIGAFQDAGPASLEFAEAIGQISPILGGILQVVAEVLPQASALVRQVLGEIVAYFQENGAQMLAQASTTWQSIQSTITAIAGPLAEVVRALLLQISTFWQTHGAEILSFVGTTWAQINEIIQVAMQLIQATIVPILQGIAAFINSHGTEIQQILSGAWQVISSVIDAALTLIKGILTAALQLIQGDWQGAWATIQGMSARFVEDLIGVFTGLMEMLKGLISGGIDVVIGFWLGMPGRVSGVGQAIVQQIWDGVSARWNEFVADVQAKLQSLRNMLPFSEPKDSSSPLFGLSKAGESIIEQILLGMQSRGGDLAEALHRDLGAAMENLNATIADAGVVSLETGEAIQSLLQTMGVAAETADASQGSIINLLETIADAGLGSLETEEAFGLLIDTLGLSGDAAGRVRALFTQLAQATGIAAGDIATSSQEIASSLSDKLSDTLFDSTLPGDAEDLGGNIWEGFLEGMADQFEEVKDQVHEWSEELQQEMDDAWEVSSPSRVMVELGQNIFLGLLEGMEALLPNVLDTIGSLSDEVMDAVESLADQVHGALADAFDATADIDRQAVKNIEAVRKLAVQLQDSVQAELDKAHEAAQQLTDPEAAAKYYQMRSSQILELAKAQQDLIAAQQNGDTQAIADAQAKIDLIKAAQAAEQAALEERLAGEDSAAEKLRMTYDDLVATINETLGQSGVTAEQSALMTNLLNLITQLGGGTPLGVGGVPVPSASLPTGPVTLPAPAPLPEQGFLSGGAGSIVFQIDARGATMSAAEYERITRKVVDEASRRGALRGRGGG